MPDDVAARLAGARERIEVAADRSGRSADAVTVIAVTKGQPQTSITAALAAGLRDVGESRIQEARAKRDALNGDAAALHWHLIGHLQHNKAKLGASLFDVVQSVDSARIASGLAAHRTAAAPLPVLLEVDLTGLHGRTGVAVTDVDAMIAAVAALPQLRLLGLMTIAAPGSEGAARAAFAGLRALRDTLRSRHGVALDELSMGMSDDFEVAVEEGATMVRLGRLLFGERSA